MKERYFVALSDPNGFRWVTFLCDPAHVSADETGFITVGESFDNAADAQAKADALNYAIFRIE